LLGPRLSSFGQKIASKRSDRIRLERRLIVSRIARVLPWAVVAAGMAVSPAWTQANLDAGKSAEQIFSNACNAYHRSPREIKPTSAAFLREHCTTGAREGVTMTACVATAGSCQQAGP